MYPKRIRLIAKELHLILFQSFTLFNLRVTPTYSQVLHFVRTELRLFYSRVIRFVKNRATPELLESITLSTNWVTANFIWAYTLCKTRVTPNLFEGHTLCKSWLTPNSLKILHFVKRKLRLILIWFVP